MNFTFPLIKRQLIMEKHRAIVSILKNSRQKYSKISVNYFQDIMAFVT